MDGVGGVLALVVAAVAGAVVTGAILIARARRARRPLERALARTRDTLEAQERSVAEVREVRSLVLDSMDEGVLLLDPEGRRVFENAALARHLGAVPADAEHLLPLDLRDAVRRASADGELVEVEAETGAPSRWLRAAARPVGGDGTVLLVVRDVTEARRIDAIRRDFVANASHELKTPVASIRAAAETLHDGAIDDPEAAGRFTEQLEREALRLSRIISDLLDLSRLETGSELSELVALDGVVSEEVQRLEDDAGAAGITLDWQARDHPIVRGSARDLALMVRNLVDNAVRYTPGGGTVRVQVLQRDGQATVVVRDTGVGIPGRDLPRVFERFYRVDRARSRETGGTGLGLAIVRHVAENHGGVVSVQSEFGSGSTFEVSLPTAAS
jgi:signal transduction histidine kinase